jgi:hypothetical protein
VAQSGCSDSELYRGLAAGDEEEERAINAQKRRKPSSPTVGSTANIPALVSTDTWVERRGVAALQIALEDLLISTFKDALLYSCQSGVDRHGGDH